MLQAFGEPLVKAFVQEAVNEALKLEAALAQLDTPKKVVIMHYAPIAATTEGEDARAPPVPRHDAASPRPSRPSAPSRSSTATRTTARPRGARREASRSTTSRCRC